MAEMTSGLESQDCADCDELVEMLFEYVDAQTEEHTRLRLANHVAKCSHCASLADAEWHVRAIVRRSCIEKAPAELRLRIVERLELTVET